MTVSECLKNWLNEFSEIDFNNNIATDLLEAQNQSYAIQKSPNKDIKEYIDGSQLVAEYYQFFARESTLLDEERIDNQKILTTFENWVENQNMEGNLPDLSKIGKLACTEVNVSNSSTITSLEDDKAIYQITIRIEYLKER